MVSRRSWRFLVYVILFLVSIVMPRVVSAASRIAIDGEFSDWAGKAHLEDPSGDTKHYWDDVRYWYWATNDGESALYFMVQRYQKHGESENSANVLQPESAVVPSVTDFQTGRTMDKKEVHYTIFIDTDDNGRFGDPGDAVVYADYYPKYNGIVLVSVFRASLVWFDSGFWGETDSQGGLRCEWYAPFGPLGIQQPGQVVRMVMFAHDKRTDWLRPDPMGEYEELVSRREADRVPDSGDLQWAPVPSLGYVGWTCLTIAGIYMGVASMRRKTNRRRLS